jgi:hypothetical protein
MDWADQEERMSGTSCLERSTVYRRPSKPRKRRPV